MIITHSMGDVTILQLFLYTRIIDKNVKTLLLDFRNIIKLKTLHGESFEQGGSR